MLGNLSPKQKKILAALGAAGALALVVMIGRRGSTAAAPDAGDLGAVAVPPVNADNGASAGADTSDWTSAFGALQTEIDTVGQGVDTLNTTVSGIPAPTPGLTTDDVSGIVTSALASWAATPSGAPNSPAKAAATATAKHPAAATVKAPSAAQATAAAKPNISFQDSGTRAGLDFQTVTKGGKVYRFYESAAGKADYGSGGKIYVRPASK